MERLNSEGIRRQELSFTLKDPKKVMTARRIDSCLLCRRPKVNEAGLCDVCYSSMEGEDLELVNRYMSGVGP